MRLISMSSKIGRSAILNQSSINVTARQGSSRTLYSSAILRKGPPTQSEESVKHDHHNLSPEELQKQTAQKSQEEFKKESHNPTPSEEASKADKDGHDPLPDHKKKSAK